MSQLVCPRCSEKGFLLTFARPNVLDCIVSSDPVGTLECPRCHTTMTFRACALPILPYLGIQYPVQRFACRDYIGLRHPMYGGAAHMHPSSNGEWIRYEEHAMLMTSRETTNSQLAGKLATLQAQWIQQTTTITQLRVTLEETQTILNTRTEQCHTLTSHLAREQRDRWMREARDFSGIQPLTLQPGGVFYTHRFPSHAEVTIAGLTSGLKLAHEDVTRLTAELAACRSALTQAEKERDQPRDDLAGVRRENAFLRRDLGKVRDQLDTTQKELAAEKVNTHTFREAVRSLTF